MDKNRALAEEILRQVGGAVNVEDVFHCMTRLRFKLGSTDKVSLDELKKISGVLGAQYADGLLQVIIGPSVDLVYRELVAVGGFEAKEEIKENLDQELSGSAADKFSVKAIPGKIVAAFSNCMGPLVPTFVVLGMLNIVAAIIGPTLLNLVAEDSDLYNNFYLAGQAIIYFLPVLVAIPASRYFKANTYISVVLAVLMLYPDITSLLASESGYTVYGIMAPNVTYSSQVIPIILIVWVQSYVEKILNKYIPDSLKVILVGLLTVVIMMPLEFLVLGPLGYQIGSLLTAAVLGLYEIAGPLETMLVGALVPFSTAFGIGRPIFFACLSVLLSTGAEYAYMPIAMVLMNFVIMGISAGYALKAQDPDKRTLGITCLIACVLGGVSEPTLFGILIPDKKTYLSAILGGGVSGLLCGLLKVGYFQFGPSNVLSVLGFVTSEGSSNFLSGCICAAVAFIVSFTAMILTYNTKKEK